jgi:uncharacterized protein (TIGR03435 family)
MNPSRVRILLIKLRFSLTVISVLSLGIGEELLQLRAQSTPMPQFEAASIKPSAPGNLRGSTFEFLPGGGLRIINGTLRAILETAYEVREFQTLGGPNWVGSERYDILANSADARRSATGAEDIKATRLRLQALLAQRFRLQVHRETRELPEYVLEVAKGGPKLADPGASTVSKSAPAGIQRSCGQMIGTKTTIANLTLMLARQLDRPVLDRTGLIGKYNFRFEWTPEAGPCSTPANGATPDSATAPSNAPSIFTVLQETLGLRLESIKGPVDSLIIDHAERPSEN